MDSSEVIMNGLQQSVASLNNNSVFLGEIPCESSEGSRRFDCICQYVDTLISDGMLLYHAYLNYANMYA